MEDNTLLKFDHLDIWYHKGNPVIKDLSLSLSSNEIVGLIGLNGAGKSTLINTMSGVHKNYAGGMPFSDRGFKLRRYTVFSEDASFQYYTFDEYVSHVFASYQKKLDTGRIGELVSGFGFEKYHNVLIRDLSTGNRRKVFLITAFALCLPLLMLDEPVNGLDFESTEFLYKMINEYRRYGTVLFSSHILESISLTADLVLVLEQGRVVKEFAEGQINAEHIREVLDGRNA